MWIAKIHIGLRRFGLLVFIALCMAALAHVYIPFVAHVIAGGVLCMSAILLYFLYELGLFQRKYTFRHYGELKEVRDYINFRNPKENYRCICDAHAMDVKAYDSCIYLTRRDAWIFFDIFRTALISLTTPPEKILILGAGGGSLISTLATLFPQAKIDAVESSDQMIHVANRYFLSTIDNSKIRWIRHDGFSYLCKCSKEGSTYDCIIVDIAKNSRVPQWIYQRPFVNSLHNVLHKHGVFFVNFIHMNLSLYRSIHIYQSIFRTYRLYRLNKNFIGTNHIYSQSNSEIDRVA